MEGLLGLFCELCQHIIERGIKSDQLWNMNKTGFIQKQKTCKIVVSKGSRNVWSKSAEANFHMDFVVCVSAAETVAPPLSIFPGKRLDRDVMEGCNIEGAHFTTAPKGFINSTLFLNCIFFFANSVHDSVVCPLVLVYDCCCSHYNDDFLKKTIEIKVILIILPANATH